MAKDCMLLIGTSSYTYFGKFSAQLATFGKAASLKSVFAPGLHKMDMSLSHQMLAQQIE